MDFSWRSFAFGFRLLLVFICVELLHYMFMICVLHELGLRLVWFEHLVCNVWWTMLVCVTLIYLCSSCGCEVVLTKLKFISYISCILYASISTCRENSVKIFKYIYVLLVFMQIYMHISRGSSLYSSNLVNLFIPYSEIFKKMSKFFQSSIPSPPYA